MDDRTTGVGGERMAGVGDEEAIGRSETGPARRRSSAAGTTGAGDRTRNRTDERIRASAGVADREEVSDERTEQIRAEIEQTRDDMSETIDAIQDRLRPRNVASNAATSVRNAAGEAIENVRSAASETFEGVAESRIVQDVRSNPIPAAMIGVGIIGLAWLALGGRDRARRDGRRTEMFDHGDSFGYYERDEYYRRPLLDSAGRTSASTSADLTGRAGEYTREVGERAREVGERAREVGERARVTTRRAQNQLQRAMRENPLAVGAAAMAIGAIIGMALPETERENELMGETRDNVVENAQEMARNAATRVQEAATDAAKKVQGAATDAVGLLSPEEQQKQQR